jgi:hypothetical protein
MRVKTIKEMEARARSEADSTHEPGEKTAWLETAELWVLARVAVETSRKAVEAAQMAHDAAASGEEVRS